MCVDTYTPDLEGHVPIDETDYSPPFRPVGADVARPKVEEGHGEVHILPIDDDNEPHHPASNPHDPTSDEAKGAASAGQDFTEISEEDEDDEAASTSPAGHQGPTSFESDSNPASTTYCSSSFNEARPIVQFALTIDAGSTGSRIHVYKFHNCHAMPTLEYETFKSINPGLSAYARDPTAAAASLDALLEEAKRVVPEELWHCSPVEVKATAGLRLLGAQDSDAILDEVRNRLETNYPFSVGGEKAVEVMEGKDEGG